MSDIAKRLLRHICPDELDEDDQVALVPRWEVKEAADEIERLRQQATQRGARMQLMREWRHMLWDAFVEEHPGSFEWFDEKGVPR